MQAAKDALSQELGAFIEEHSGEEGLIEDAKTDKGKVTKASVKARMKELLTDEVDASLCSLSTLPNTCRVDKRSASTISTRSFRRVDKRSASTLTRNGGNRS